MFTRKFTYVVLTLVLTLAVFASGCSSTTPTPEPTATASLETPEIVAERFYSWYTSYPGNPIVEKAYRTSSELTPNAVKKADEIIASFTRGGYDPFLCAQDIPQGFIVDTANVSGEQASLKVHGVWNEGTAREMQNDIEVTLNKTNDTWKIEGVTCPTFSSAKPGTPSDSTPVQIVNDFYAWYLDYARTQGNPLINKAYHTNAVLSDGFVQKVDGIVEAQAGFDPILCAQDIPEHVTVEEAVTTGDIARAIVQTSFEGHRFTVALQQTEGQWTISDVSCEVNAALPGDNPTSN